MRIAVTGGAGLTGQCAVRDLIRSNVDEILVGDYDSRALETLRTKLKGSAENVEFRKIDVTKASETARALKGYDVVVNAVQYYHNLRVMSAALEAQSNYLDFGGLFHTTLKQIREFDSRFKDAGLLGVAGIGAQPGITNLMVKNALSGLDQASSVEILDGWRDPTESNSPLSFTWSPLTFFDESSKDAMVFENGKYSSRPALSEPERVRFPKPVGEVDVYLALHSEVATIPKSFKSYGLKKVVWKEGGTDLWKIKFLADLGLTSDEAVEFNGAEISPRKFLLNLIGSKGMLQTPENSVPNDFEITRVIVQGRLGSAKKKVIVDAYFPSFKPWRVSCSQYNVGIPGSIAAQMIGSGKVESNGVRPAEQVFEPRIFFKELAKRRIRIRQRTFDI
jgi:lysine 6-dehydrogenase